MDNENRGVLLLILRLDWVWNNWHACEEYKNSEVQVPVQTEFFYYNTEMITYKSSSEFKLKFKLENKILCFNLFLNYCVLKFVLINLV